MTIQTKERAYSPFHSFVAMLLLLSMLVQSCGTRGLGMKDGDFSKEEPGILQGRIASPLPNVELCASAQAEPPATIASADGANMTSPTQPTSSGGKEETTTATHVKRRSLCATLNALGICSGSGIRLRHLGSLTLLSKKSEKSLEEGGLKRTSKASTAF